MTTCLIRDPALAFCARDSFRTAGRSQLFEDTRDVRLDRVGGHKQLGGDFVIGAASGDELQNFSFAMAERGIGTRGFGDVME